MEKVKKFLDKGIHKDIPDTVYHGDGRSISSSQLSCLLKDEDDFRNRYVMGIKEEGANYYEIGKLVHQLFLEPHKAFENFAIYPGAVRRGKEWNAFKAEHEGKSILIQSEAALAKKLVASLRNSTNAVSLVNGGEAESSLVTEINGIIGRARPDYMVRGSHIVDVKTTVKECRPKKVYSIINQYHYDLAAAYYMDIANLLGLEIKDFYWVFVNKKNFTTKIYRMTPEVYANGKRKYEDMIARIRELKRTPFFDPNYKEDVIYDLELPMWALYGKLDNIGDDNGNEDDD
jgi:hypothetical protein